jgi:hypothetical protein
LRKKSIKKNMPKDHFFIPSPPLLGLLFLQIKAGLASGKPGDFSLRFYCLGLGLVNGLKNNLKLVIILFPFCLVFQTNSSRVVKISLYRLETLMIRVDLNASHY